MDCPHVERPVVPETHVRGGIEDYLNGQIDSLVQLLDQSVQLNYERWSINTRTLREHVLYSTYDQYIQDLRDFLSQRIPYLKNTFAKLAGVDPNTEPDPGPKVPDFPAKQNTYYTIRNIGTGTILDVNLESNSICANARNEELESQQWLITPLANGYMFITNRATGYTLNDPTEGTPTATTLTGTQLNVAIADSLSERQQWDIVSQGNGQYNLVNRFSEHAANLSNGGTEDGTPILSYTSDDRDATSNNRLWYIDESGEADRIAMPEVRTDYALAYDPQSGRLHFGAEDLQELTFEVRIYDQSGRLVRTFRACDGTEMYQFPRGLYLISWKSEGKQRTVKLVR